jgi:hypothetical protein
MRPHALWWQLGAVREQAVHFRLSPDERAALERTPATAEELLGVVLFEVQTLRAELAALRDSLPTRRFSLRKNRA